MDKAPIRTVSAKETEPTPQNVERQDSVQGAIAMRRALLPLQVCRLPREAEDLLGLAVALSGTLSSSDKLQLQGLLDWLPHTSLLNFVLL